MLFTGRTARTINHTLIHEIEHVAQIERRDVCLLVGYATNLVFLGLGILLGLSSNPSSPIIEVIIIAITALFGLRLGYMLSLHEIQARKTSRAYNSTHESITFAK